MSEYQKRIAEKEAYQEWEQSAWKTLHDYLWLMRNWREFAPHNPDEKCDERYIYSLHHLDYAEYLCNEFIMADCKGYAQLNENMRFSELAEWYFENYAPEELKPTTILNYESQYRNHIAPIFGNKKLKDITTPMLTEFLKVLVKEHHLNPISVRKVYIVVQSLTAGFCKG